MMKRTEATMPKSIRESGIRIKRQKDRLYKRLAADQGLKKDFDYFISKTGWSKEYLIGMLFWDCNMMNADPKRVLAKEKNRTWTISESLLLRTVKNILKVAALVERVNQTDFSPVSTISFCDENGDRLSAKESNYRRTIAASLPDMLRMYAWDLRRKVSISELLESREAPN